MVRSHETVQEFRVELELGRHFVHQVDNAGEFPAGLEKQPGILAALGAPDNGQDHFHDRIELTEQPLVQTNLKALLGQGHFLLQVLPVTLEISNTEAIFLAEGGGGDPGEKKAVDVFDLIVIADFTGHI